jgi:hypothetical protein
MAHFPCMSSVAHSTAIKWSPAGVLRDPCFRLSNVFSITETNNLRKSGQDHTFASTGGTGLCKPRLVRSAMTWITRHWSSTTAKAATPPVLDAKTAPESAPALPSAGSSASPIRPVFRPATSKAQSGHAPAHEAFARLTAAHSKKLEN